MEYLEITNSIAKVINNIFENFDFQILQFYHNLHTGFLGKIFDMFFHIYTHLGDDGILLILIGIICLLFKKSRRVGLYMLGGVIIGALFTNVAIKPLVERPRPFEFTELYNNWWVSVGSVEASSMRSFPSGHTTSAFAGLIPLFLYFDKKKSWIFIVLALLMGASRNYVMVHYPSDVLGGIIIGLIAGIVSFVLINRLLDYSHKNQSLSKILDYDLALKFKK